MRRDNLFLVVALGLGAAAWLLLRPRKTGGAPATSQTGAVGGGVPGSPNQVHYTTVDGQQFNYDALFKIGV